MWVTAEISRFIYPLSSIYDKPSKNFERESFQTEFSDSSSGAGLKLTSMKPSLNDAISVFYTIKKTALISWAYPSRVFSINDQNLAQLCVYDVYPLIT